MKQRKIQMCPSVLVLAFIAMMSSTSMVSAQGGAPFLSNKPPVIVTGSDPIAVFRATNSQPGIVNPSLTNLPPAAVRGEATDTTNFNVGVFGISDGSTGAGVLGIASGPSSPMMPSGNNVSPTAVVGIATGTAASGSNPIIGVKGQTFATFGPTRGVEGEINSPDGVAVRATAHNGGFLFIGQGDGGDLFAVNNNGHVSAHSFSLASGNLDITPNGGISTNGNIQAGFITTNGTQTGSLSVGSLATMQGGADVTGNLTVNGNIGTTGNMQVNGSLFVVGAKNAVAKLPNGRSVVLYAMESPENWFEDFGSVRLYDGVAWVAIDQTFAQAANVEAKYHVFLTPAGNCRGLYVAKKTSSGFEVRELGHGRSNIAFDYRIVSRRKGFEKMRFENAPPFSKAQTEDHLTVRPDASSH